MAAGRRRHSAPKRRLKKKRLPAVWAVAAVLLAAGAAYLYLNDQPDAEAPLDYGQEDVAHERPIHVVHEMGSGPPIPFLPADQPQPKIVVPESFYDFGRVGAKAVVKRKFLIRNAGDAPLTISRAYTTCGCTTADFSASVIPPGKVALVTLVFDAGFHDVRGKNVKRGIIIENNDRQNSKAEIWVGASVTWN